MNNRKHGLFYVTLTCSYLVNCNQFISLEYRVHLFSTLHTIKLLAEPNGRLCEICEFNGNPSPLSLHLFHFFFLKEIFLLIFFLLKLTFSGSEMTTEFGYQTYSIIDFRNPCQIMFVSACQIKIN